MADNRQTLDEIIQDMNERRKAWEGTPLQTWPLMADDMATICAAIANLAERLSTANEAYLAGMETRQEAESAARAILNIDSDER